MVKTFKREIKKLQWLFNLAIFSHKIVPIWNINYFKVFLHAIHLCRNERFMPAEAFRLGLFRPNLVPIELSKYISRKKLTKVQESLNPPSWATLLKDKSIFYRYCMALDIPIPKLYGIFIKRVAGWSYKGSALRNRDDWKRFFDNQLPQEFVIKPVRGAYGRGVNIFRKTEKGFIDAFAKLYTAADIYDMMFLSIDDDSFLIQERLKNHLYIVRISSTEALQTVRIITFIDSDYQCHILHAHFKTIVDHRVIDTFLDGLTGNIEASVTLTNGVLKPANQITSSGEGIRTVHKHPKTGISFEGFKLPFWTEACSLVKEAAPKFLPIRTIGWDVALTPNGPYIMEGNIWWEPPNQHRDMDIILNVLSRTEGRCEQDKM